MKDERKTRAQLINELNECCQRVSELETAVTEWKQAKETSEKINALLSAIGKAQSRYIGEVETGVLFGELLNDLLFLTRSEYGFIGEILYSDDGLPYLRTHAISNIAWDKKTRGFYEENASERREFHKLKSLFGAGLTTGRPVISNNPSEDPRSGGLPKGHPSLKSFLGIPFGAGGRMVGMVGIANRPQGYDEEMVAYLQPFLDTCGNLAEAHRDNQRRKEAERSLRKTASDLGNKTERLAKLYELGITTGRTSTEIADKTVSIIATALDVQMATVEKIIDNDMLRVVSFIREGQIFHEGIFPLDGTPCEEVKGEKKACRYHRAKEKFPQAAFLQQHGVNTYLGVPILSSRGEVMGTISAMDGRHIESSQEDIELLYTMSRRMALEWDQEAKISQIEQANKTLENLYQIASTTAQSIDMNELLKNILDVVLRVDLLSLGERAAIFLVDEKAGEIVLTAQQGFSEDMEQYDKRVKMGECLCGQAALSGEILISMNCEKDPRHSRLIPHSSAHGNVFDALISKRPYKEPFSQEKSFGIIMESSGSHFDPDVVDVFFTVKDEISAIKEKYKGENESLLVQMVGKIPD